MPRSTPQSSRISSRNSKGAITGGTQASSSKDASSSTGLQANLPRSGTTSGVVTRSASKRAQEEESLQNTSKGKKKSKNNSPPLGKLFWIFYHELSDTAQSFLVTEDMLDKELSDMRPLFGSIICDEYDEIVLESSIRFRTSAQPINLGDVNSGWMENLLTQFGPSGTVEFKKRAKQIFPVLPPYSTMREVLELVSKGNRLLHLIVTARVIQTEHPNTAPLEEEEEEVPDELFFIKRFGNNMKRGLSHKFTPPSAAGKSKKYICEQNDSDMAIYDGRHGVDQVDARVAPPIQIFNPVFEDFYHYLHHPGYRPSQGLIRDTYEFMEQASVIWSSENVKVDKLRSALSKILKVHVMPVGEKARADGSVWLTLEHLAVVLVVVEVKREYGEGGCDPATQASFAFRNYWLQNKGLVEKCCCPTFIIAVGGPWLGLLGGIFTDKFIVQRLTELTWTGYSSTYEDVRIHWLARIFNALSKCTGDLIRYYEKLKETEFEPSDYFLWSSHRVKETGFTKFVKSRLFPYPQTFIEKDEHGQLQTRKFRYIRPLEQSSACVTYEAEICDGPLTEKIVVKFVAQYGADVHRFLAEEGHAPKLRYFGPLLRDDGTSAECSWWSSTPHCEWDSPGLYFGRIQMVVMNFVEKIDADDIPDQGQQIANVLRKLHDKGFVFGDLRPPNVMFSKEDNGKVKFIDFDWSGCYESIEDGSVGDKGVRYPLGLSNTVIWPLEAKEMGLELIKPEHDWFMLEKHFHYIPDNNKRMF